jgi:hypothetical protein
MHFSHDEYSYSYLESQPAKYNIIKNNLIKI